MPGIKITDEDQKNLEQALICTLCKLLLKNPIQTDCGHLICKTCVQIVLSWSNPKCPEDGTKLKEEELFPDKFIKRKLGDLNFHCLDASCGWFGCYNDIQIHTSTMCKSVLAICKFKSSRMDIERQKVVCEVITGEYEFHPMDYNHDETRNGTLVWKIEGYERKREDAINGRRAVLYSPHFYSAQFGYKMCAKIYFNGNGLGEMSHLSLFIVVMREHAQPSENVSTTFKIQ
ncbi:TNF receptor-associated factor 4-like isoform X2 [Dendronephthya gigantea]|uniref:TNF receptor-associated factor 4-like isoform X2 n=1 Tax=Dendronephthya gigantea TaxID=151771 RepID=UPI0010698FD5|nr:TNF receptor-associated factor 4-like isoform X2 [Dendronephthya gigantea]